MSIWPITGQVGSSGDGTAGTFHDPCGAFVGDNLRDYVLAMSNGRTNHYVRVKIDANADTDNWGNPMEGHANGKDIHPYNIKFLPLIKF